VPSLAALGWRTKRFLLKFCLKESSFTVGGVSGHATGNDKGEVNAMGDGLTT
jgi:hypothetical protein